MWGSGRRGVMKLLTFFFLYYVFALSPLLHNFLVHNSDIIHLLKPCTISGAARKCIFIIAVLYAFKSHCCLFNPSFFCGIFLISGYDTMSRFVVGDHGIVCTAEFFTSIRV